MKKKKIDFLITTTLYPEGFKKLSVKLLSNYEAKKN